MSADLHSQELAANARMLRAHAHEISDLLNTMTLAVAAIKAGHVGFGGATAVALDRSLVSMRRLVDDVLGAIDTSTESPQAVARQLHPEDAHEVGS